MRSLIRMTILYSRTIEVIFGYFRCLFNKISERMCSDKKDYIKSYFSFGLTGLV